MKQAIAGVTPAATGEVTIMTVWPSVSLYGIGRSLGKLYEIQWPGVYIFRLGNLMALLAIPLAALLYLLRVGPYTGIRYKLTNRRLVVLRGLMQVEEKSIELDRFNSIEVQVLPGQSWYHAGELIFRNNDVETFRLSAVSRPETFRQVCLKALQGYAGVKAAVAGGVAAAV